MISIYCNELEVAVGHIEVAFMGYNAKLTRDFFREFVENNKEDIKPWLKENGYTWEDMDKFWEECCEVNWKCQMIRKSGKNWSDMTMYQIKQLPILKETTLQQIKEKEEEEKRMAELEQKKKDDEQYYRDHFDEIMAKKIDVGEDLTVKELKTLAFECEKVDEEEGDSGRWSQSIMTVVKLCDRFFAIDWERGLTERQENEFYNQPYEVEKNTYEKTIMVTEWNQK